MDTKQELRKLDLQRRTLESEAAAITDELLSPTITEKDGEEVQTEPMGIDTPLVDAEGYPRNDIDIYRARDLRKRLNEIRYDHKSIMKQIERLLAVVNTGEVMSGEEKEQREAPKPKPKYDPVTGKWVVKNWDGSVSGIENGGQRSFDNLDRPPAASSTNDTEQNSSSTNATTSVTVPQSTTPDEGVQSSRHLDVESISSYKPFALIDEVSDNSPAKAAGILVDDIIVEFGTLKFENFDGLQVMSEIVSQASLDDTYVKVVVLRGLPIDALFDDAVPRASLSNCSKVEIHLRPRPWAGRGLIGCHLKRYSLSHP